MTAIEPSDPIEVDARGLRCPLPVIRLAEAAREARADARITVLATDPAARHDIAAWCRMRDHELLEVTDGPGPADLSHPAEPAYVRFVVLVRSQPPNASGSGSGNARASRAR